MTTKYEAMKAALEALKASEDLTPKLDSPYSDFDQWAKSTGDAYRMCYAALNMPDDIPSLAEDTSGQSL